MNLQLKQAILSFIANEFKLDKPILDPDFDFSLDLGLNQEQISEFLNRLQESLDLSIPEDKISNIHTLSDLFFALDPDSDDPFE